MSTFELYTALDSLPQHLRKEVADFIASLKKRHRVADKKASRPFGLLRGQIRMADNFDEPLEDFRDYME